QNFCAFPRCSSHRLYAQNKHTGVPTVHGHGCGRKWWSPGGSAFHVLSQMPTGICDAQWSTLSARKRRASKP
ncbi:TPA: hypothetical protein N0F65_004293, partial [Lagenidium giganteum]